MNLYDMPFERYEKFGPGQLTDSDLLAIILRSGSSENSVFDLVSSIFQEIDFEKEGLCGLFKLSENNLLSIKGIGKVKASQIVCIVELAKRMYMAKAYEGISFDRAETIADYYKYRLGFLDREETLVVYLNTKLKMINDETVTIGTINSSLLSPRDIFIKALKNNAVYIVLLHNHPSGDPHPSKEDINVTYQLKNCGDLLNIPVLDHIIIGNDCFYSMKEHGLF